jgi:hypothetical protein
VVVTAAGGGNGVEGFPEFNQETGTLDSEPFQMQELSIHVYTSVLCLPFADNLIKK